MPDTFKYIQELGGLRTDYPEDKIPDRNASDILNIDLSIKGLIQTAKGRSLVGNKVTAIGSITSAYLYKKAVDTVFPKIHLRIRDNGTNSILEWLNTYNNGTYPEGRWEAVLTGLTTGAIMGFTPFNTSDIDSTTNSLVFCNGVDSYYIWNTAQDLVSSVTANTIVSSTTSLAGRGFAASGSVIIDGTEYAYSALSGGTFTGVTPDPTTQAPAANTGIVNKPTEYAANPKGNVLLTAGARVWLAKSTTLFYSKTGDPATFTAGTNPKDGGIEDFPDAGGEITLLDSKDNNKIIVHKEDGILIFNLTYTETAKVPYLDVVTLAENSGASNLKAGAGLNTVTYFVTGQEALKSLQRAKDGAELNLDSESDIILPTIRDYDFSTAAAIYSPYQRAIYVACKETSSSSYNDKIVVFYVRKTDNGTIIDISVNDGYVGDWVVDGKDLYAHSSVDQNTYLMGGQYSNDGAAMNHKWVSKEFTFQDPAQGKEFDKLFIDGFIRYGTKIKISVLYGILGSDEQKEVIIAWDDTDYVYSQKISALGTDVIGTVSVGGSSGDIQDSYAFSVPIHFDVNKSTRYKIKIETYYDEESLEETYWAISTIGTNPKSRSINFNKVKNSNV